MKNKTIDNQSTEVSKSNFILELLWRYRLFFVICFHLITVIVAFGLSFSIRFDFKIPSEEIVNLYALLPFVIISRMVSYYYFKSYSSSWSFAYLKDIMDLVKAVLLGSAFFLVLMMLSNKTSGFPRSVFLLDAFLNLAILSGTKFFFRYCREYRNIGSIKLKKNILIVGAGKAGMLLLNEIRSNAKLGIYVSGFIDEDVRKKHRYYQGIPVLGITDDIPHIVDKNQIEEIVIAMPSAKYKDIVRITKICDESHVKTRILPGLGSLIVEDGAINRLQDVNFDDMLRRETIQFRRDSDRENMENEIAGKVVLVTGAGGSIGSELCRQLAIYKPKSLILYERAEGCLYDLELELKKNCPDLHFLPVVGDILDTDKFRMILRDNGVNIIYHAAAYKHVPMMEREPIEAVRNNVFGSMNVAKLAIENKVTKLVLISTDKAVKPANVMGLTKRIAELIMQSLNCDATAMITVRFGNVIGSSGSVIPLFKKQISEGGPVTITHPDVTRYFMSIPEAVQLVMSAGTMGNGKEIFLLDMGKPIKITDIADELIQRSGLKPGEDIDIEFVGLRPGEKLHEELYWQGEGVLETDNKKITMLKQSKNENHKQFFEKIDILKNKIKSGNDKEVFGFLINLIPEAIIKIEIS